MREPTGCACPLPRMEKGPAALSQAPGEPFGHDDQVDVRAGTGLTAGNRSEENE